MTIPLMPLFIGIISGIWASFTDLSALQGVLLGTSMFLTVVLAEELEGKKRP